MCDQQRFVFVLDEWDFIFHKDFVTEENNKQYVLFLSNLLKDRSYVQLTYMTGILPIADVFQWIGIKYVLGIYNGI